MPLTKPKPTKSCAAAITCIALTVAIAGCSGDKYQAQRERLQRATRGHQIGYSPDYMLTKHNTGEADQVALIFGMLDDYEFCTELADMYMKRYPLDSYSCEPAN